MSSPRIFANIERVPYRIRWQEDSRTLEGSYNPISHTLQWDDRDEPVTLEQRNAVHDWCVELRFLTTSEVL